MRRLVAALLAAVVALSMLAVYPVATQFGFGGEVPKPVIPAPQKVVVVTPHNVSAFMACLKKEGEHYVFTCRNLVEYGKGVASVVELKLVKGAKLDLAGMNVVLNMTSGILIIRGGTIEATRLDVPAALILVDTKVIGSGATIPIPSATKIERVVGAKDGVMIVNTTASGVDFGSEQSIDVYGSVLADSALAAKTIAVIKSALENVGIAAFPNTTIVVIRCRGWAEITNPAPIHSNVHAMVVNSRISLEVVNASAVIEHSVVPRLEAVNSLISIESSVVGVLTAVDSSIRAVGSTIMVLKGSNVSMNVTASVIKFRRVEHCTCHEAPMHVHKLCIAVVTPHSLLPPRFVECISNATLPPVIKPSFEVNGTHVCIHIMHHRMCVPIPEANHSLLVAMNLTKQIPIHLPIHVVKMVLHKVLHLWMVANDNITKVVKRVINRTIEIIAELAHPANVSLVLPPNVTVVEALKNGTPAKVLRIEVVNKSRVVYIGDPVTLTVVLKNVTTPTNTTSPTNTTTTGAGLKGVTKLALVLCGALVAIGVVAIYFATRRRSVLASSSY